MNDLYCRIVMEGKNVEYHVSNDRSEVEAEDALSKRWPKDSPNHEVYLSEVKEEIKNYKAIEV